MEINEAEKVFKEEQRVELNQEADEEREQEFEKLKEKIKLCECPYCKDKEFQETISEFVSESNSPYLVMDCYCNKCEKSFTQYYSADEIKFEDKDEEDISFSNTLSKEQKDILVRALNVLVEKEQDTEDYSEIYNILNGGLYQSN